MGLKVTGKPVRCQRMSFAGSNPVSPARIYDTVLIAGQHMVYCDESHDSLIMSHRGCWHKVNGTC